MGQSQVRSKEMGQEGRTETCQWVRVGESPGPVRHQLSKRDWFGGRAGAQFGVHWG